MTSAAKPCPGLSGLPGRVEAESAVRMAAENGGPNAFAFVVREYHLLEKYFGIAAAERALAELAVRCLLPLPVASGLFRWSAACLVLVQMDPPGMAPGRREVTIPLDGKSIRLPVTVDCVAIPLEAGRPARIIDAFVAGLAACGH